ncbi:LysE family translocator [uncultured Cedecea sp.]|uniref:LysE family translocator n=1 Tax=uncultured Cedecea sp. TaxID=988762 RepID=UPI00261C1670|nr:LysE family translocator [uncultured Cedecea sp.]
MNIPLLSAYILAVLLLIMTPGPVVALITSVTTRDGSRRAFSTLAGTNAASLVLMAAAILMLSGVMSLSELSLALLGIPGCIYIGYIARQGILSPASSAEQPLTVQSKGVWGGFITGLSNPKDILFFMAFFPQFIPVTASFSTSVLVLALVWTGLDFAVLSFYILAIKRWVKIQHQRTISLLSSWILLAIACAGGAYNVWTIFRALAR